MLQLTLINTQFPGKCSPWGSQGSRAAPAVCLEGAAWHRRTQRRLRKLAPTGASGSSVTASAVPAAPPAAPEAVGATVVGSPQLPFFPDRRCVEELQLPSLAECHHYINLTNGVEAMPRLRLLGVPYKFLRLPSTRCEQQQFEALVNDLDADLLMRLALGQCCLVYDFGSRNKKRGAPRAVWYGLEFIRYALRRLWLQERGPAYLRGYSVANVFEEHVSNLSKGTKKKLRYYKRYISPEGLPHIHLYGVYSATAHDGNQQLYAELLRQCECGGGSSVSSSSSSSSSSKGSSWGSGSSGGSSGSLAELHWQQQQQQLQQALVQQQQPGPAGSDDADGEASLRQLLQQSWQTAAAPLQQLSAAQQQALLHGPDIHAAVEGLLGMRLFLGGVSHQQYHQWAERTGFLIDGSSSVEL